MYLRDKEMDGFADWLQLNQTFWQTKRTASETSENEAIFVDLFHDNPDYLLRSLLTGRLLGIRLNLPIIGLTGSVGIVREACGSLAIEPLKRLADSFGISLQIVDSAPTRDFDKLLVDALTSAGLNITSEGPELRHFIANWALDCGFPIGRFVYDSYLRADLVETLRTLNERFIQVGREVLAVYDTLNERFKEQTPRWVVVGHVDYNPFGIMADCAMRNGSNCIFFRNEGQMRFHLVSGPLKKGQTLLGRIRETSVSWQLKKYNDLIVEERAELESHSILVNSGRYYRSHRAVNSPNLIPDANDLSHARTEILNQLSLSASRPTVVLFQITFADIPLTDEQVFDDNFDWLEKTLEFGTICHEINWVVKIHPYDHNYNVTGAIARLQDRFSALPNISFLDEKALPSTAFTIADVVTTVRGTPGIQAAILGIPVVLSGRGFYSDFGFADVANNKLEYFNLLVKRAFHSEFFSYRAELAKSYQYCEDVIWGLPSTFLGAFGEFGRADYWVLQSQRLASYSIKTDMFAIGLFSAIDGSLPRVALK